jgi:hypothetical protein
MVQYCVRRTRASVPDTMETDEKNTTTPNRRDIADDANEKTDARIEMPSSRHAS